MIIRGSATSAKTISGVVAPDRMAIRLRAGRRSACRSALAPWRLKPCSVASKVEIA